MEILYEHMMSGMILYREGIH